MAHAVQVVIDCRDPGALSEFWAAALGYELQPPPEGYDSWEALLQEMGVPEEEWNTRGAVTDPDGTAPVSSSSRCRSPRRTRTASTSTSA